MINNCNVLSKTCTLFIIFGRLIHGVNNNNVYLKYYLRNFIIILKDWTK
jgi:hypothetical protein